MKIFFLGAGPIALRCLEVILDRRGAHQICGLVGPQDLVDIARRECGQAISFTVDTNDRREELLLQALDDAQPDLVLSVQYPWILSSEVIQAVGGRIVNLHNAKLPDYRGHHSISHALLNGDRTYTSTLHWMAPEVDRGYCIDTETIDISAEDTAHTLWIRTIRSCVLLTERLVDRASGVEDIPDGNAIEDGGHFYSRKVMDSIKSVPLDASVERLVRIARACHFPPYEPAYIEIEGFKTYLLAGNYSYFKEQGGAE